MCLKEYYLVKERNLEKLGQRELYLQTNQGKYKVKLCTGI